jgi:hypothetical protein
VAGPVYKLYLATPRPNWYKLSKDEQEKILAKLRVLIEKAGGKSIVQCFSGWSNEQYAFFGLEEFPDVESVQKYSDLMAEINHPFEYFQSLSILGTKMQ